MAHNKSTLLFKNLGIDTYKEAIIYLRADYHMCLSEGFKAQSRIKVSLNGASIIATINLVKSNLLLDGEASLSGYAQKLLNAKEGDKIIVAHAKPVKSLSFVRSKIYGNELLPEEIEKIIFDIVAGYYSDIHISAFLTACAGKNLNLKEILSLTQAMVKTGDKLCWDEKIIVDKHCIGGLPGNRTTPIVVSIVSAFGLTMPKTSSRAITSPAGTADSMEVLTNVEFSADEVKKIIAREKGCIVWGGSASLSPADDILIRIERVLDLDSEGQLVASIMSKKIAVGSSHVVIEIPVGPTAKMRNLKRANILGNYLKKIGKYLDIKVKIIVTDGSEPIGRGIGPALEARDFVAVLKNEKDAPQDLRSRALMLAGEVLEFSSKVKKGQGKILAEEILSSGKAWQKFQDICRAQGGMKEILQAKYIHPCLAQKDGVISAIDNRHIAMLAKLAGAPLDKEAGVDLFVKVNQEIRKNDPLFAIHTGSVVTLEYVLDYFKDNHDLIQIEDK